MSRAAGSVWAGLALFVASGAVSLGYELAWVRLLTLEFGSTTLAVSTVVAVFMGGLSLGALAAGRWADRSRRPMLVYGLLEVALACYAAASPWLFPAILSRFTGLVLSLDGYEAQSLLRLAFSVALLLTPTMLMGATLPVLTRWYADRQRGAARGAGLLYALNTLGGFAGVLLTGFVLLPRVGLSAAMVLLASANLAGGIAAIFLGRRDAERVSPSATAAADAGRVRGFGRAPASPGSESQDDRARASARWAMAAVAATGCAALSFQVAWTRLLSLVLGASVYAFAVVLATVLAGIGLGSAALALARPSPARAERLFAVLALASAFAVAASFLWSPHLPPAFVALFWTWGLDRHPERAVQAQFALSSLAMLGPAALMGGLFPVAARWAIRSDASAASSISALYASSTVGAIAGAVLCGFVVLPSAGLPGAVVAIVCLEVLAMLLAVRRSRRPWRVACGVAAVSVLALAALSARAWRPQLMTSGVFQYASTYRYAPPRLFEARIEAREDLLYYRDGLTATVTVTRDRQSPRRDLYVSTNGKIDGSSESDMPTQRLSAHVPLLLHRSPQDVCVIGLATGCTAGSASLHPLRSLTVVEIERAMIDAARFFSRDNHDVLSNPRASIEVTDGRLFLRTHPRRFDVIISEPSNPWLAGTSDLFTREFFELGANALAPDGLFCQWVQLYGLAPDNLQMLVRTFVSVFPEAFLVTTIDDTDLLLVGSRRPVEIDLDGIAARMARPDIADDLADRRVGIGSPFELLARFRMGPREVRAFAGEGLLHTDDRPLIAYRAPRDLYRMTRHLNSALIARYARGVADHLDVVPGGWDDAVLRRLAEAYEAFVPGGREASFTRQVLRQREASANDE